MRTDNELLELAAKAAGIEVWPGTGFQAHMLFTRPAKADPDGKVTGVEWNPLTEDGDALRLAINCNMTVCTDGVVTVSACSGYGHDKAMITQSVSECGGDKNAATRRAIVRAAAELGAHPKQHNDGGAVYE